MSVAERMTADRYLAMADEDPRRGLQLIAGEVVVSEPGPVHQRAVGKLFVRLVSWIENGDRRGETFLPLDVKLDDVSLEPGPGESLSSPLLPGFELALDELFPG